MVGKYDSMVIYERPISTGRKPLYGYVYNSDEIKSISRGRDLLKEFAEYVVGVEYWLMIGGKTSKEKTYWLINQTYHHLKDDFVINFGKEVYKKHPVKYKKYDKCYPQYCLKDLDGQYIINENYKLWI